MMLSPVRAMTSGHATPLSSFFFVVISTLSGRVGHRAPSASACDGVKLSINAASASTPFNRMRSAAPCHITQAEPSFTSVPSGDREIRLVSGPPSLVSLVSSILIRAFPTYVWRLAGLSWDLSRVIVHPTKGRCGAAAEGLTVELSIQSTGPAAAPTAPGFLYAALP